MHISTVCFLVVAIAGASFAAEQSAAEEPEYGGRCKTDKKHTEYFQECLKENQGEKFDSKKYHELPENDKEYILICIAKKGKMLSDDGNSFNKEIATKTIDDSTNTPDVKKAMIGFFDECCAGKNQETDGKAIVDCIQPKVFEYCRQKSQ